MPSGSVKYSSGVPSGAPPRSGPRRGHVGLQRTHRALRVTTRRDAVVLEHPDDAVRVEVVDAQGSVMNDWPRGAATGTRQRQELVSRPDPEHR